MIFACVNDFETFSAKCVDKNLACSIWADEDYCSHPDYKEDLKVACPASCDVCKIIDSSGEEVKEE
jgi:ShK domain-like